MILHRRQTHKFDRSSGSRRVLSVLFLTTRCMARAQEFALRADSSSRTSSVRRSACLPSAEVARHSALARPFSFSLDAQDMRHAVRSFKAAQQQKQQQQQLEAVTEASASCGGSSARAMSMPSPAVGGEVTSRASVSAAASAGQPSTGSAAIAAQAGPGVASCDCLSTGSQASSPLPQPPAALPVAVQPLLHPAPGRSDVRHNGGLDGGGAAASVVGPESHGGEQPSDACRAHCPNGLMSGSRIASSRSVSDAHGSHADGSLTLSPPTEVIQSMVRGQPTRERAPSGRPRQCARCQTGQPSRCSHALAVLGRCRRNTSRALLLRQRCLATLAT